MSLPLWGKLIPGESTLGVHMLLTNPYNNTPEYIAQNNGLGIELTHRLSPLSVADPMTFTLYIADADPLAGAKLYKQRLKTQGKYITLADKLKTNPEGKKLLGASHVYL